MNRHKIFLNKYILRIACIVLILSHYGRADARKLTLANEGQEWIYVERESPYFSPTGGQRRLAKVEGDITVGTYQGKNVVIYNNDKTDNIACYDDPYFDYTCWVISMEPDFWGITGNMQYVPNESDGDDEDDEWADWTYVPGVGFFNYNELVPTLCRTEIGYDIYSADDKIIIEGNTLIRKFSPEYNSHVISIEGIGPALVKNQYEGYFALTSPKFPPYIISEAHKPGYENPITETDFLRGLPLEKYADDGKKNVFEWPAMLRTDRVWVYGAYNEADNSYYESYCRFGDWVREGYCMYRPFYEYKRMYWPDADDKDNFRTDEGGNIPVALIREEAGRVHFPNDYNESKEIIYDFNEPSQYYHYSAFEMPMVNGETFNHTPYSGEWKEQTITEVEIDGAIRRKVVMQSVAGYEIESIEGIGIINRGFLPYIYGEVPEGTVIPYLARYCDGIETVIEEFKERPWEGSAVRSIADSDTQLNIFFDLHGRQVKNPQPGSIYIRNGKKVIF